MIGRNQSAGTDSVGALGPDPGAGEIPGRRLLPISETAHAVELERACVIVLLVVFASGAQLFAVLSAACSFGSDCTGLAYRERMRVLNTYGYGYAV